MLKRNTSRSWKINWKVVATLSEETATIVVAEVDVVVVVVAEDLAVDLEGVSELDRQAVKARRLNKHVQIDHVIELCNIPIILIVSSSSDHGFIYKKCDSNVYFSCIFLF